MPHKPMTIADRVAAAIVGIIFVMIVGGMQYLLTPHAPIEKDPFTKHVPAEPFP